MRRRFVKRSALRKPQNVQWSDVSGQFVHATITATAATALVQLQSPTSLASLTADPPEDLTILRMRGTYEVTMAAAASAGNWTLALTVADVTWTPGARFATDSDKRILWSKTFGWRGAAAANTIIWSPPGHFQDTAAGVVQPVDPEIVTLDIAPKVKLEPGRALYLVAYENIDGVTFSVSSQEMRLLYKRSGRR